MADNELRPFPVGMRVRVTHAPQEGVITRVFNEDTYVYSIQSDDGQTFEAWVDDWCSITPSVGNGEK
jgi:hypothetical protein